MSSMMGSCDGCGQRFFVTDIISLCTYPAPLALLACLLNCRARLLICHLPVLLTRTCLLHVSQTLLTHFPAPRLFPLK
jgi:hypothetical protein